jgi:hypothetical protein
VKSAPLAVLHCIANGSYKNKLDPRDARGGNDLSAGRYDFGLVLNREERAFAETVDDAEVIVWWCRNPNRKP